MNTNVRTKISVFITGILLINSFFFSSCKENIDTSDLYTFTGETIIDVIKKDSSLSHYKQLLDKIPQSSLSSSSMASLLSARGNYTCFAPNNQAIDSLLDSLYNAKVIASKEFNDLIAIESFTNDSIAKEIVYNSIIDNGKDDAYETAAFPTDNGNFVLPNFKDRYLSVQVSAVSGQKNIYYVENHAEIINPDQKTENGYVHTMNKVVLPSNIRITEQLIEDENLSFFASLLELTGWAEALDTVQDESYEREYLTNLINLEPTHPEQTGLFVPEHRKAGFTIFAETDEVYDQVLKDITGDTQLEKLANYLQQISANNPKTFSGLTFETSEKELRKSENAINRFVSYHILPVALSANQLVIHFNEYNYDLTLLQNNGTPNITIPVYEFYETMNGDNMRRRLIKISESQQSDGIRLNRTMEMDYSVDYQETSIGVEGIKVAKEKVAKALNGYIYPLEESNELLIYTDETIDNVLNTRIRFDAASLMWEMINLGYRRPLGLYPGSKKSLYFPPEFKMENIEIKEETKFCYLAAWAERGFANYQGDELNIVGNYDITITLPPVPDNGTYEIRYGIAGFPNRGMAQVYFGEKGNLQPEGIPMDLRLYGNAFGWEANKENDMTVYTEINKRMRNKNNMQAPRYTYYWDGGVTLDQRADGQSLRRIIYRGNMNPDKTYQIRIKSVLENKDTQLYIDYFEIVPKNIYDNPSIPEDQW